MAAVVLVANLGCYYLLVRKGEVQVVDDCFCRRMLAAVHVSRCLHFFKIHRL